MEDPILNPMLCIAPVAANAFWQHNFRCGSAQQLRNIISTLGPRGPYTVQYHLENVNHWVRIYNEDYKSPMILTTGLLTKDDSIFIWNRVQTLMLTQTCLKSSHIVYPEFSNP